MTVCSAARLHFGFLDMTGGLGRKFGSVGLSITDPRTVVRARASDTSAVYGADEEERALAMTYAGRFYEKYGAAGIQKERARGAVIHLEHGIPPHIGLGSGTQLALCVTTALCELYGVKQSVREAAVTSRRGLRSGIGIESFRRGGFIVDAGSENPEEDVPLPLFRHAFPRNWRIILAYPPAAKGLSGADEELAFRALKPDPGASAEICRLVLMKLLPGLIERKIERFGDAIERMQRVTGESFSSVQSGCFASPLAEDIFAKMRQLGARGMGQSSWGPVVYGFLPDPLAAAEAADYLAGYFAGIPVRVVAGRNIGARVRRLPRPDDGEK